MRQATRLGLAAAACLAASVAVAQTPPSPPPCAGGPGACTVTYSPVGAAFEWPGYADDGDALMELVIDFPKRIETVVTYAGHPPGPACHPGAGESSLKTRVDNPRTPLLWCAFDDWRDSSGNIDWGSAYARALMEWIFPLNPSAPDPAKVAAMLALADNPELLWTDPAYAALETCWIGRGSLWMESSSASGVPVRADVIVQGVVRDSAGTPYQVRHREKVIAGQIKVWSFDSGPRH